MFDAMAAWGRCFTAANVMAKTGVQAAKTIDGAGRVVNARGAIIGNAVMSPWSADYAELGRMLPEKIEALSRAGAAAAAVLLDGQSAWMTYMQHLSAMTMRGRPPTMTEMADLGDRSALLMVRSLESVAKLASVSLAPVRRQVNANVRRLNA